MIKLYDFLPCPFGQKVRIVLAEKSLEYELIEIDLPGGEQRKPEFLRLNPYGKVPVLIDEDTTIYDSTIINEYLEEKFPDAKALLPRNPVARARARAFEDYADAYLMPSLFKVFFQLRKPEAERDQAKIAEGHKEAREHFAYLERELQNRDYFAGEFSLADISFVPPLANLERAGFSIPDDFPRLKAWWKRMQARTSFGASWPGD
jgi:glutathione S-transferase